MSIGDLISRQAYEELHVKYEQLFAAHTKNRKRMDRLSEEREKIIEVGLKLGMRRSHLEMISSEEEDVSEGEESIEEEWK